MYLREGDPKGWSTVPVTALGSWGKPVPPLAMHLTVDSRDAYVYRFEGRNSTLEMYNDTDVDYDYPHPGCRIQCRVKALSEAGLPLSLATLDGTLPDLTPAPGLHMAS